jgi:hypothetical protein
MFTNLNKNQEFILTLIFNKENKSAIESLVKKLATIKK